MMISFKKYPVDIILCMLWSIVLLPFVLLDLGVIIRIILGLPFLLFIPGYVLIFVLFPTKKTDKGISVLVRIALSFGFSIAVVSLIGFGLNYTSWGIQLESVILSLFVFVIGIGVIAIYRWFTTEKGERFIISIDLSWIGSKNKLDKTLTILIIISMLVAVTIGVYVIVTPKQGERFTSFYILTSDQTTEDYPENLAVDENGNVIIGILNHEYVTIDYTVEIWLIQEDENSSIIQGMWFLDKISVALSHAELEIGEGPTTQWEYDYSFSINRTGSFKLVFLLFNSPTDEYSIDLDYRDIAEEKISNAYRETHLWIDII